MLNLYLSNLLTPNRRTESDKFKPLKHQKHTKYIRIAYFAIISILLLLIVSKEKKRRNPEFSLYKNNLFSTITHDITNWQQDQDELKFPNSKGHFEQLSNDEVSKKKTPEDEEDDRYAHYSVTADGVSEQHHLSSSSSSLSLEEAREFEEKKEELFKTVSYYDLNEFQGSPEGDKNGDVVLLLIPLRNAQHVLPLMFKHLMNLSYKHSLIDLAFLVSDCSPGDKTLDTLFEYSIMLQNSTLMQLLTDKEQEIEERNKQLKGTSDLYLRYMDQEYVSKIQNQFKPPLHSEFIKPFRSVQIFEKNFGQVIGQGFSDRHAVKVQGIRRKLMGRARNWLINTTLKPYHSWVYWRDADIEEAPASIIQDLMKFDYDVVVPNVWRPLPEFLGKEQPYDLNTWIESPPALELAKTLQEDDVIVEGYAEYPTWRVHLAYLKEPNGDPNQIMDMDGVGGVSILAKAKVFRQGVSFPAFTFENHAETEAFGKMAKKVGFRVGGLPHYTVWHIYEPSEDDLREIARTERKKRRQQSGR